MLNVNENPYMPPADVIESVHQRIDQVAGHLNRYPDREFTELRQALAEYLRQEAGVEWVLQENIWAANGSNEVMKHLFQAFGGPGRRALSFTPTYSMYPEYARETFTQWHTVARSAGYQLDLGEVEAAITELTPSLIVVASPNNPTGTALDMDVVAQLIQLARGAGPEGADSVVVLDEAYGEFRRAGRRSGLDLVPDNPHLVVSRTLSKAFAYAGARLGYLAADPSVIDCLRIVRLPYHLSAFTQAAALAALDHADQLQAQVESLRAGRDELVGWLRHEGYDVVESDANFVLFGKFADRHLVWRGLLDGGVLIRETGPEGYLRVSVGTPDDMRAFKDRLQEVDGR